MKAFPELAKGRTEAGWTEMLDRSGAVLLKVKVRPGSRRTVAALSALSDLHLAASAVKGALEDCRLEDEIDARLEHRLSAALEDFEGGTHGKNRRMVEIAGRWAEAGRGWPDTLRGMPSRRRLHA